MCLVGPNGLVCPAVGLVCPVVGLVGRVGLVVPGVWWASWVKISNMKNLVSALGLVIFPRWSAPGIQVLDILVEPCDTSKGSSVGAGAYHEPF